MTACVLVSVQLCSMQLEHFEISLILYQLYTRVEDFKVLFWKILSYEEKSILTNTAHRRLGPYTV